MDDDEKNNYACDITDSDALYASDRAKDISQCWNVKEDKLADASNWCKARVSSYIDDEYIFGHSVEYEIRSGKC